MRVSILAALALSGCATNVSQDAVCDGMIPIVNEWARAVVEHPADDVREIAAARVLGGLQAGCKWRVKNGR